MARRTRIPELEVIEFDGSASIAQYSKALRALGHDLGFELDGAADDIEAVLRTLKGHPLLLGIDVRLRARKVSARLRRAQELAQGVASEAVAFNAEYRRQFVEAAEDDTKKKSWEF